MSLGSSLFYTTGLLLQDSPFKLPTAITNQMLVGWWCVFSILVGTMYRSSLVAHLSLPTKGSPVETFEQLLVQDGWSWGLEPTYGAEWEWFKSSTTPAIKDIFQGIEILDTEAHLERVVRGGHALLTWKYHIHNIVASRYTDTRGYTPVHIGRVEYFVSTGYGWGFRLVTDIT
ncbi:uncharacterized protein LOC121863533 [Homarus americanus]|uniref:uncharacterized protein LOC121863533 n=1 Tax=Homarus americanus TaxID=6706 RepID=UPI001C448A6A|nr:uncharacterized protein LOC121863533 [Homarus americanus]